MADVSITTSILGLDQIQNGLNKTSASFKRMGDDIESAGTRFTAGITAPLLAAGGAALKFALDAEESENLFTVSMGSMEASARQWSEDLNKRLGLNDVELRKTVGTLNVMAKSMGISEKASFEMSKGVAELSHDMASFFNLDPAQAFEKIRAGITGEAEPLKQLGILVNETTVKMTAMNHGIIRQGEELSEQQKVLARYITILESTSAAQGDLARTIESPTNQLRIMGDRAEVLARTVGEVLRPYLIELINVGKDVLAWAEDGVKWFKSLDDSTKNMIVGIAGFAAAMGPLLIVVGSAIKIVGVFAGIVAAIASPIGLAVAAIGVLAVAGTALAIDWDGTVSIMSNLWNNYVVFVIKKIDNMVEAFGSLTSWVPGFESAIKSTRKTLSEMINDKELKIKANSVSKSATDIKKVFDDLAKTATKDSKDVAKSTDALIKAFTKEAQQAGEADEKVLAKRREMSRKRIDLAFEEGRITTDEKIRALREQLDAVQANSEEEIKIREELLKTYEDNAAKEIEIVKRNKELTRAEQLEILEMYRAHYESIGESGEGAAQRITDAMSDMNSKVLSDAEQLDDEMRVVFRGMGDDWADVAKGMHGAFSSSIGTMLANGEGLKDGMSRLFDAIKTVVANKIGEIITSRAWQALIAGPTVGGALGGAGIGGAAAGGAAGITGAKVTGAGIGAGAAAGLTVAAGATAGAYILATLLPKIEGTESQQKAVETVRASSNALMKLRAEYLKVIDKLSKQEIDDFNKAVDKHYELVEKLKPQLSQRTGIIAKEESPYYRDFSNKSKGPQKLPYGKFARQQEFLSTAAPDEVLRWEANTEKLTDEYNYLYDQWKTLSLGGVSDITPTELEQRRTSLYLGDKPQYFNLPDQKIPSFSEFVGGTPSAPRLDQPGPRSFARGGSVMITRPTMLLAGENGPEKLTISPNGARNGGGGSGGMNFYGPVIMDEITARMFARDQAGAIARENDRYAY